MKKVFKNIIVLLILGTAIFIFRDSIIKSYFTLQDKYFPCTRQISYSIGSFDSSFGIKKEDFLNAIKKGEDTWETVVNKDLFVYQPDGSGELKINLVYDTRQENTQKLKSIDAATQTSVAYFGLDFVETVSNISSKGSIEFPSKNSSKSSRTLKSPLLFFRSNCLSLIFFLN